MEYLRFVLKCCVLLALFCAQFFVIFVIMILVFGLGESHGSQAAIAMVSSLTIAAIFTYRINRRLNRNRKQKESLLAVNMNVVSSKTVGRQDSQAVNSQLPTNRVDFDKLSNSKFILWFSLVNILIAVMPAIVTGGAGLVAVPFLMLLGSAGSWFALLCSRWWAMKTHSITCINENTNHEFYWLVDHVRDMSNKLGMKATPQIGIYPGPEINAFATGPNQRKSLIAFSSPLLETMTHEEIKAVAAHEAAHIANRDMVAMTMLQGFIRTFILAAILPIFIMSVANRFFDKYSWKTEIFLMFVKFCVAAVLTFFGGLVVKHFSRRREYRADAVAALLVGPEHMKAALNRLSAAPEEAQRVTHERDAFAVFKINGIDGRGLAELFSTHPLVEKRIAALDAGIYTNNARL